MYTGGTLTKVSFELHSDRFDRPQKELSNKILQIEENLYVKRHRYNVRVVLNV